MKIAVMMRAMDQDSGFRVYVEHLVDAMVRLAPRHRFLLLYHTPKWFGRFAEQPNVTEVLGGLRHKLLWDQISVPLSLWRERADVLLNPKFSVPLVSTCPVTMGLQEPAWWACPAHHPWWDVAYMRLALPLYVRRSAHVFPWSDFNLMENRKYLGLPLHHATVAPGAPSPCFRPIEDQETLAAARTRFGLPARFVLAVTRVENIGNSQTTFTDTKNVQTAVRAYAQIRDRVPHALVVAGRRVREYLVSLGWTEDQLSGVRFLDFVPNDALPAIYSLAEAFLLPSFYEGFAFTMTEAMACGCPVIASHTGACPETAGGAAILADPDDASEFARKLLEVLASEDRRRDLRRRSLERAASFSWDRTASIVLDVLERVGRG